VKNFVVSLHDVAPSTAETSRRWLDLLESRGIRASLLVVPGVWNGTDLASSPAFCDWLRNAESRGHEIVMHGYSHTRLQGQSTTKFRAVVGSVLARGCEEFWHLSYDRARELLARGRDGLRQAGFSPRGFIAPGWLMSEASVDAARHLGFDYTCTHTAIVNLQTGQKELAFTTSQRPRSSLSRAGIGVNRLISEVASQRITTSRIAIHPNDLLHDELRRANLMLCESARRSGRESCTYGDIVPAHVPGIDGPESKVQRQ
jgi:predicted deacetylase